MYCWACASTHGEKSFLLRPDSLSRPCVAMRSLLAMRKLDPSTKGASALIGVRVSQATLDALDALGARAEIQTPAGPVRLPARSLSRAEALRIAAEAWLRSIGLLPSDIASSATQAPVQPPATPSPVAIATPLVKPSSKPAKGSTNKPKAQALREAVLAALKAAERPGSDLRGLADVVRACSIRHELADIQRELLSLGTEGVLELRPDSGWQSEKPTDRTICPRSIQGDALLTARWLVRPG